MISFSGQTSQAITASAAPPIDHSIPAIEIGIEVPGIEA